MLEIKNISVKYDKLQVLKNLSFNVDNENNIVGILGKNGAGKTTLFNAIFGDLDFSGEILWDKKKLKRDDVSYIETQNYFYPFITGKEYLNYFGEEKQIEKYGELFKLPLKSYVNNYSTGMKKKLALLSMLLLDKPIIVLDEPFNGLDFESVHLLYDIIKKMKDKGKIVLISSHIIETLFNTCDKIVTLNNGYVENVYYKNNFENLVF
ncbi:ATP-binding cassette domain-containing protein [Weeksellaceae bacterium TAE3-ERU29]|nr:ATP-binding cassette domain-containing protein [Weeksellaceae bacterium TAE3-ERU29]